MIKIYTALGRVWHVEDTKDPNDMFKLAADIALTQAAYLEKEKKDEKK